MTEPVTNLVPNALYIKKKICDKIVAEQANLCSELMTEGRFTGKQVSLMIDADEAWLAATKAAIEHG